MGCVMRAENLFSPAPACSAAIALTTTPRRVRSGAHGGAIGDRAAGAIACREASVGREVVRADDMFCIRLH